MDTSNSYSVWFWRNGETKQQRDADSGGLGAYAAVEAATGEKPRFLTKEGRDFWTGRTGTYRVEVQKNGPSRPGAWL
jgi:hypothetical protein